MSAHIAVVGGGVTGLAAVEHLTRSAPQHRVTLLESSDRLGGHVRTVRTDDGFIMEGGPDVLLTAKPAALDLAARVGLADRVCPTNPAARASYILRGRALHRMPDGLTGLVPSRLGPFIATPLVSPLGKARVALDYLLPPRVGDDDESIKQFVIRRLGREMYERLVEPLLSGISAGDGAQLSIDAMFPQLRVYEREHGSVIRGMLAARRRGDTRQPQRSALPATAFASFATGLQELIDAVERTIRCRAADDSRIRIRRSTAVSEIVAGEAGHGESCAPRYAIRLADGEVIAVDAVILATPAFVSASLVELVDATLARRLAAIEYASTVTISLAYPINAVGRPLDATGYVTPRIERRPVLACTWSSAKFTGRAPAGAALFRLFLGGVGRIDVASRDDAELLAIAAAEMRDVMGISAAPTVVHVTRHPRAMPQYTVGHRERVAGIAEAAARLPGLELAGAIYLGLGIPDCVRSGIDAADRALRSLPATEVNITGTVS